MQIYRLNILALIGTALLISGCSSKKENVVPNLQNRKDILTKPYQLKITPIIGSRQDDAKVIMDMGKIMKIWIAPYKNQNTFVSSHDNYVVAKAPDFVVGENVPQQNWKAMKTPVKSMPFLFRDADLDKSDKLEKEEIVQYNNNIYKQQNDVNEAQERIEESSSYDKEIKAFLAE